MTLRRPRSFALTSLMALCLPGAGYATDVGVSSLGATGGLHTPSAFVLPAGEAAASIGNAQDPRLGTYDRHESYTLGFGLGGGVELFGRLTEYTNPSNLPAGQIDWTGIRDISANVKWQIPMVSKSLPKFALGATDLGGGAVFFRSVYAVASDTEGPLRWSLGYARGTAAAGQSESVKVLDGVFGGAELRLLDTRATLLAESTGSTNYVGLRYYSEPLSWLGRAQLVSSIQKSLNGKDPFGAASDSTSVQFSLVVPLGADGAVPAQHLAQIHAAYQALPAEPISLPAADRWALLTERLRSAGFDRVRIGLAGKTLVVEFENQRYLRNEVDALGIVFGLAAEHAPQEIERVHAVSRKNGLAVFEASLSAEGLRGFLRWGDAQPSSDSITVGGLMASEADSIAWVSATARAENLLRVSLSPLLNTAVGTELGLFDYSLAVKVHASVPLWRGAQAYADVVQRVSNSSNMDADAPLRASLIRSGTQTVAVQQSFWLGSRWFSSIGVGRYQFGTTGAEVESKLLLPWGDDSLHFSASSVSDVSGGKAWSASYRWQLSSSTWIEPSVNQYTDGARGPGLALTRWFGDVNVQLFARKDLDNTFAGVKMSLPLTPRQGMSNGPLQIAGSPRFDIGLRTRLAQGGCNCLLQDAVRPLELSFQSESEQLNAGRLSAEYVRSQLERMRESFYLYGRPLIQ